MEREERIKSIFYMIVLYIVVYLFLTFLTGIPLYLQPLGFAAVNLTFIGGTILNQIALIFIKFEKNAEME